MRNSTQLHQRPSPLPLVSPDVPWVRRQMDDLGAFSRRALENRLLEAMAIAEYGLNVGERLSERAIAGSRRALPVLLRRAVWEWAALWGGISLWLLY